MGKTFSAAPGIGAAAVGAVILGGCSTILGIDNDYSLAGGNETVSSGTATSSSGTGGSSAATSSSGTGGSVCVPIDDQNACTHDVCENGVPVSKPAVGDPCGVAGTCSAAGVCVTPCSGKVDFTPVTSPSGGNAPSFVATADLDGDGKLDFAIANADSGYVSVQKGDGNGVFTEAADYPADYPVSIAAMDLHNDGWLDLVVANNGSVNVSVLKNLGTGKFASPVNHAVGVFLSSVAALDLNHDGWADLVVTSIGAGTGTGTVNVLFNQKNGDFAPAVPYGVGKQPRWVAAADLDHDGWTDLAVANGASDSVSVLLGKGNNKGDGTFQAAVNYGSILAPNALTAVDLNGDGWADLAITNSATDIQTVTVLINDHTGSFGPPVKYLTGVTPSAVAALDVNGDGWPDLVVANAGSGTVSVLINLKMKTGQFANEVSYPAGPNPSSIAAANLNADGRPNLVVANKSNNTVTVLLNTCAP